MAAVAEAAARDARGRERIRAIGWPVAIVAAVLIVYSTAGLMMSAFSAIVVGALDLLVGVVVKVATTASAGGDVWSIAASLGRATAAVLASPSVTTTILALQGIAVAALIALQRLLRSDEGSHSDESHHLDRPGPRDRSVLQPGGVGAGPAPTSRRALREQLEQKYDLVPLTDGVGLRPKARGDVRLVEVTAGTILVNGAVVTGRELRDRLGADADAVLRLSVSSTDELREVAAPPAPPAPAAAPPAPDPPLERAHRSRVRRANGAAARAASGSGSSGTSRWTAMRRSAVRPSRSSDPCAWTGKWTTRWSPCSARSCSATTRWWAAMWFQSADGSSATRG